MITTVPMSADEAKQMGLDLVKKKGGEMLSKISGIVCTLNNVHTSSGDINA